MTNRYARVPEAVFADKELSSNDVRVYCALANGVVGGNIVSKGQRLIAQLARMDRRTVRRSLDKLARRGHISSAVTKLLKRQVYQLNSPVFLQENPPELGVEMRPQLGVVVRPCLDRERGALVSFPRKRG